MSHNSVTVYLSYRILLVLGQRVEVVWFKVGPVQERAFEDYFFLFTRGVRVNWYGCILGKSILSA